MRLWLVTDRTHLVIIRASTVETAIRLAEGEDGPLAMELKEEGPEGVVYREGSDPSEAQPRSE